MRADIGLRKPEKSKPDYGILIFAAFLIWCIIGDLTGSLWAGTFAALLAYSIMAKAES